MFERGASPGHLANWAGRLFARRLERRIRPLGISAGQVPVLLSLADSKGLSQKELVQRSAIEQPAMAAILKRMEASGLVVRLADQQDRRASIFRLAPRSGALLGPLLKALDDGNTVALSGFTEDEAALLTSLLRRLIRNMDEVE